MGNLQTYCHNCDFWKWEPTIYTKDGRTIYPGHCGLESCKCINAVAGTPGFPLPPIHFRPINLPVEEPTSVVC